MTLSWNKDLRSSSYLLYASVSTLTVATPWCGDAALLFCTQKKPWVWCSTEKKNNVAWGLFSLHHIYWPAPVTPTLLGDTWSCWPFIWTSKIWTKASTEINYLNIAESCMLWPIFVNLQCSPGHQLPKYFHENLPWILNTFQSMNFKRTFLAFSHSSLMVLYCNRR